MDEMYDLMDPVDYDINGDYEVAVDGVAISIPLDLDSAKEFGIECGMDFVVRHRYTGQIVYAASEYEYSRHYVEIVCEKVVWL